MELVSRSFVTTDLRLAGQLGESPISVALGLGNAWHRGYHLPDGALGAGIALVSRPSYHISLGGELQLLRVTSDRSADVPGFLAGIRGITGTGPLMESRTDSGSERERPVVMELRRALTRPSDRALLYELSYVPV